MRRLDEITERERKNTKHKSERVGGTRRNQSIGRKLGRRQEKEQR